VMYGGVATFCDLEVARVKIKAHVLKKEEW
jgi:hypothetical protein